MVEREQDVTEEQGEQIRFYFCLHDAASLISASPRRRHPGDGYGAARAVTYICLPCASFTCARPRRSSETHGGELDGGVGVGAGVVGGGVMLL